MANNPSSQQVISGEPSVYLLTTVNGQTLVAPAFAGDGSKLTGIPSSGGSGATNAVTYDSPLVSGNIPKADGTGNGTIIDSGIAASSVLTSITSSDTNIATFSGSTLTFKESPTYTGTVTATAFAGDGSQLTGLPSGVTSTSDTNIASVSGSVLDLVESPTYTGTVTAGTVTAGEFDILQGTTRVQLQAAASGGDSYEFQFPSYDGSGGTFLMGVQTGGGAYSQFIGQISTDTNIVRLSYELGGPYSGNLVITPNESPIFTGTVTADTFFATGNGYNINTAGADVASFSGTTITFLDSPTFGGTVNASLFASGTNQGFSGTALLGVQTGTWVGGILTNVQ